MKLDSVVSGVCSLWLVLVMKLVCIFLIWCSGVWLWKVISMYLLVLLKLVGIGIGVIMSFI